MRLLAGAMVLAACATAPATAPVTAPQAPLLSTPTATAAGFFPLPEALRVDPRGLPIKPFELTVRAPRKLTLGNGLTLYLVEDHTSPLVNVRALIGSGALDDPPEKLGRAELTLELLASGGTAALDAAALDELFEFHAADLSASAGDEYSTVSVNLRAADLETLLPVYVDVLLRPRFQADRLQVAVLKTLESIRRRPDRPDGVASRALSKAVFGPTSLLGRESTAATVKAITVEDLKRFHAAAFTPANVRLIVTGDFSEAALRAQLERLVGSWKGGAPGPRVLPPPAALQRRVILVPRAIAQAKVRIGGWGYQRKSPDEFPMRLVATTLGAFGVGRLYKEIRDERGLAYSAFASVNPGPTTGLFVAGFDAQPEKTVQALEETLRQLERCSSAQPVSPAELSLAADMAINSFAFRFDSPAKIAFERAVFDLFGYPDDYLSRYRERVAAVGPAQAQQASGKLAAMSTLQIVVVGPPERLGDLTAFGPVTTVTDVEAFR